MKPEHVLLLFLDGVGVGRKRHNPFFVAHMPNFMSLLGGSMFHLRDCRRSSPGMSLVPVNATLGVPGLPQSGTGQTTLLTGTNAPKFIGRHFGPYPYSTLKPVIAAQNIFRRVLDQNRPALYANAFPQRYVDYITNRRARTPAITFSWISTGHALHDSRALAAGRALSADVTNERWPQLGYPDVKQITPREAGRRLTRLAGEHAFTLFEYYFTDHAGHSQSMDEAVGILQLLDALLEGILDAFDPRNMLLLVTSDHGNMEDLSVKTHTRNPVPLLAFGRGHDVVTRSANNLTHIAPLLVTMMS